MDIVIADSVKSVVKWTIGVVLTAFVLFFLIWGVREARKPCPVCNGAPVTCPDCGGTRVRSVSKECPKCKGTGKGRVFGNCSACNGYRLIFYSVTCGRCNGAGTIKCQRCHK